MQTITLRAHFDGRQILLDEPYELEPNTKLIVSVVYTSNKERDEQTRSLLMLADQTEFRLSPAQWKAFCERLDEPAKVIPALRDLFEEPELAEAG